MVNAIELLGPKHFPCVAHTLQLSVKKGLAVIKVEKTLSHCRKLVGHFKHSPNELHKLEEKQKSRLKLPKHRLCQEVATCWGSTLAVLEPIIEQETAIVAVLMEGRVSYLMPEGEDHRIMEMLVDILQPFQQAAEAMSAVKYPTPNSVKPLLFKPEKTLTETSNDSRTAKDMKKAI